MPKVIIKEKDNTTPGSASNYSNYAVLITGFAGKVDNPVVKADANNAYEFTSTQAFIDTIGLLPPSMKKTTAEGSIHFSHYGNQMAYELLNTGYPIIYRSLGNLENDYEKPIDVINAIIDANMWEPFKDRASYDFRFITHGLLSSSELSEEESKELYLAEQQEKDLKLAIEALAIVTATAEAAKAEAEKNNSTDPEPDVVFANVANSEFEKIRKDYIGFKDDQGNIYANYADAATELPVRYAIATNTIERINSSYITENHINIVNRNIADLAAYVPVENPTNRTVTGRGDCIALIELDERCYTTRHENIVKPEELIIKGIDKMASVINEATGSYCALTVPSVEYNMSGDSRFSNNKKFPGAFHYLTCFLSSIRAGFAEWYAAAGYTRGTSNYVIDHTTVKLGEIAINALEPRQLIKAEEDPAFACNVIANFRGSYYLWGNRTAQRLGSKESLEKNDLIASSFLNIKQLCITIKKQLYIACRTFTFSPNSDTLWVNFVNAIAPTLDQMRADQGISDYRIIRLSDDGTKKAILKAKIRIIPIEAVEDFELTIDLEDSFGETTAVVNE